MTTRVINNKREHDTTPLITTVALNFVLDDSAMPVVVMFMLAFCVVALK